MSGWTRRFRAPALIYGYINDDGATLHEFEHASGDQFWRSCARYQYRANDQIGVWQQFLDGSIIGEPLIIHNLSPDRRAREERVVDLLETVGLSRDHLRRYPHEFSGGQRQRIGIARAPAVSPKLIICDEPVSALDVSVQAQVINLLQDLQEQFDLTYLFIAHNLSVVEHISNRVAVMYLGKIMGIASARDLYESPVHPYSQALLSALPIPDPKAKRERIVLKGDVMSTTHPTQGCLFFHRCPVRETSCATNDQLLTEVAPGHAVSCQVRTGVHGASVQVAS